MTAGPSGISPAVPTLHHEASTSTCSRPARRREGLIAWILFAVALGLRAVSIYRARRDLRRDDLLTRSTAVAVWLTYIVHGAAVLWAAIARAWPMPLAPGRESWALGRPEEAEVSAHRLGGVLIIVGAVIVFAAVWEFRSLARMSGRRTDKLITTGPYRYSRNPQNVGWFLGLLGIAVYGRSSVGLLFAVLLLAAFRTYVPIEEKHLERVYGTEWQRYRQHTPRFLGLPTVDA